jgi:lipoprotein-releasing system ATP-binding protein
MSNVVISCRNLYKTFNQGELDVPVLSGINLEVSKGETLAIIGASGSGKSTLLHLLGGLDAPSSGEIQILGQDILNIKEDARCKLRNVSLGFIYQFHHLLPEFSAAENVILPQMILGKTRDDAEKHADELLGALGLADRLEHRPAQLSGGEQQRVAIARAVANAPSLLLADEPTGNLDPHTAEKVFQQLMKLIHDTGLATIVATHNLDVARRMDRIWQLEEGNLLEVAPADV